MPATASTDDRLQHADRWTVADAIDFEHLAAAVADDRDDATGDAAWYAVLRPALGARAEHRRAVFRAWLDRARARTASTPPGTLVGRGLRVVDALSAALGFALGCGVVGGLLAHRDAEPINALLFFGGTVGVQLAIVALVLLTAVARLAGVRVGFVRDAVWFATRLAGRAPRRVDVDRHAALFDLRTRRTGPLAACRVLIVTQVFAIAFNVGLLAAMLLVYLPFVELRFGWQSTYSFTADGVAAWVRAVAAPWSWIAPGLVPDGADVAATRYTRGQPATTLPADAAHAWWPFLTCAIAVYGLLLRVAIAAIVGTLLRRRLAALSFAFPDANVLWRRLQGPLVTSRGGDGRLPDGGIVPGGDRPRGVSLAIVDAELASSPDRVRASVERVFGGSGGPSFTVDVDDDRLARELHDALRSASAGAVVVLAATRDPIVAMADFVRAVAAALPPETPLTLLLVSARDDDRSNERAAIWRRFVAIQRLPVDVESDARVEAARC